MSELPELIKALLEPETYPERPQQVELAQTQISYVFLAGEYVYKIKKPLDMGFLDYTTLEKRRYYCGREVDLNRRLCADTYLGVVPVIREKGRFVVGGKGEAVEYAVRMRRLPQDAMMDVMLGENRVTPKMVEDVARTVADFHRRAATSAEITEIGGIDAVIKNTSENFEQTNKYFDVIVEPETYRRIKAYTEDFIKVNAALFRQRMDEGRVRDGHGDLHAAHVCFLKDGICIYDCIEFIDRFRYTDVAAEVAFLAMDLDHYGRNDLADIFVKAYIKESGDKGLLKLLNFFKCYRAYVRGKVGCFQYDDPQIPTREKEKIKASARSYFKLAESYIGGTAN
jgi:aminoglycoside phosphotransferase family enzyme